jgi:hypothetical protein
MRSMSAAVVAMMLVLVSAGSAQEQYYGEQYHSSESIFMPKETRDTETSAFGISNHLLINPFNIFINPAQMTEWGTVYGELWNENAAEWGGATVQTPFGKLGVFAGRPYTGQVNATAAPFIPRLTPQFGAVDDIYNLSVLPLTNHSVDILFGVPLGETISVGAMLSLANSRRERKSVFEDTDTVLPGEGSAKNVQDSGDVQLTAGLLLKDLGFLQAVDLSVGLAFPRVNNEYTLSESTFVADSRANSSGSLLSDNGLNVTLLARGILDVGGENRLIGAARLEMTDASSKETQSSGVTNVSFERKVKTTGMMFNLDAALHTMPYEKLKLIYSAGLAMLGGSTEVLITTGKAPVTGGSFGVPVGVSLEHQTFEKLATRFSVVTTLFSSTWGQELQEVTAANTKYTLDTWQSPVQQAATVACGFGWTPAEKVTIDVVLKANVFDLDSGAGVGDIISRASVRYSY